MFTLGKNFISVVVILTLTAKAKLEMVPFCEMNTIWEDHYHPSVLNCYNYKSLPTDLTNPKEINALIMQSQYLEKLTSGVFRATKLTSLDRINFRNNAIRTIEVGAFSGLELLEFLWLEKNKIEEIDLRVFKDLPNLQWLFLAGNPLKGFASDAEFPRLNITWLTLSNCKITSIPPKLFINLEKLYKLALHNNQLQVLNWKVFLPLKALKILSLGGNPYHCDCQVKFLSNFLDIKDVYYKYPTCQSTSTSSNKQLIGIEWNKIDKKLLVCPPQIISIHMIEPKGSLAGSGIEKISVECEYEGYPEPNVTWIGNERLISFEDAAVTIETQRDADTFPQFNYKFKQILTIPSSPAFYGNYKCQVSPNLVAALNVEGTNLPSSSVTPAISTSTEFKNTWTTEGTTTTPSTKNIYKSSIPEPSSTDVNIFSTAFQSVPSENSTKDKNPVKNVEIISFLQIITAAVLAHLLLGGIITSGIYIAVRYKKTKRQALPNIIYKTVPRSTKPNSVSQTMTSEGDPPSPPLRGEVENVYVTGESNDQ